MSKSAWFDETSATPLISEQAQRMETFLSAMADGKIDANEVKAQEERMIAQMKLVEPLLNDDQHAQVTKLLVEMAAYDLMQVLHSIHEARPKTVFRG